jgi:ABC-2 type transport system ATP-binding protein
MALGEQLLFLAELKGTRRSDAGARLSSWLERMGLTGWRGKRVNGLSKGMQQKARFATVLRPRRADPRRAALGSRPRAADLMRDVLVDLSRQGKTLILSSHQMETVERLCDSIALIDRGVKLLDGAVAEVKRRHGRNTVVLAFEGDGAFLRTLPGVERVRDSGRYVEVQLSERGDPQRLLQEAAGRLRLSRFELVEPSLHDIFVARVTGRAGPQAT